MENYYIVGHTSPDTDSVVSAIGMAYYNQANQITCKAARAGELNKETIFVLNHFQINVPDLIPEGDKSVCLVDHNEPSQISPSIDLAQVKAIVDHHKLGGLSTSEPINVDIRTLGSASTIVALKIKEAGIKLEPTIAGALMSGIISDTLNLTSPTTTEKDKAVLSYLNDIVKLDVNNFASEMFKAKSDISDVSTEDLLSKDYKEFNINNQKIGFGVFETVSPDSVLERKTALLEAMTAKKQANNLSMIFFCVVDIYNSNSYLLVASANEQTVAETVFNRKAENDTIFLPGIVSRKKQMIPPLEKYLTK